MPVPRAPTRSRALERRPPRPRCGLTGERRGPEQNAACGNQQRRPGRHDRRDTERQRWAGDPREPDSVAWSEITPRSWPGSATTSGRAARGTRRPAGCTCRARRRARRRRRRSCRPAGARSRATAASLGDRAPDDRTRHGRQSRDAEVDPEGGAASCRCVRGGDEPRRSDRARQPCGVDEERDAQGRQRELGKRGRGEEAAGAAV